MPLLNGSLKIACGLCFVIIQQQEKMLRSNQWFNSMQNIGKTEDIKNSLKDHFTVFSWGLACTRSIIIPFGKLRRIAYRARKGLHMQKKHQRIWLKEKTKSNKANRDLKIASASQQREITLALLLRSMPDPPILFKWNNKQTNDQKQNNNKNRRNPSKYDNSSSTSNDLHH